MRQQIAYSLINRLTRGQAVIRSSGETNILCPKCRYVDHLGNPTLHFNIHKGGGRCVYCDATFNVYSLARAAKLDVGKLPKLLPPKKEPVALKPIEQDWLPLFGADFYLARKAKAYLYSRGVTDDIIRAYRFGVSSSGRLAGRIIMPVYEGSNLVYYQARIPLDHPEDVGAHKYINPKKSDGCLGKSQVLAYSDNVSKGDTVLVTEGMFSAIGASESTGFPAVAILGKTMSEDQAIKLSERNPSDAIVMLDPGTSIVERMQVCSVLKSWGVHARYIELPTDGGDPWDLFVDNADVMGLIVRQVRCSMRVGGN